ncbi:MAG: exodeoxyribonuclease VII large subunit, partial [Hyphomicrobiales bacterium]|nr:exodeoxyribonuclease VII large subunit [Hyphomicrobiales bacterium]
AKRLRPEPIGERIARDRERLGAASTTLRRAQQVFTVNRRQRIETLDTLLRTLSYRSVLARGFALVRTEAKPIHAASKVSSGAPLDIEFHDGHVSAIATSGKAARRPTTKKPGTTQGSLF